LSACFSYTYVSNEPIEITEGLDNATIIDAMTHDIDNEYKVFVAMKKKYDAYMEKKAKYDTDWAHYKVIMG